MGHNQITFLQSLLEMQDGRRPGLTGAGASLLPSVLAGLTEAFSLSAVSSPHWPDARAGREEKVRAQTRHKLDQARNLLLALGGFPAAGLALLMSGDGGALSWCLGWENLPRDSARTARNIMADGIFRPTPPDGINKLMSGLPHGFSLSGIPISAGPELKDPPGVESALENFLSGLISTNCAALVIAGPVGPATIGERVDSFSAALQQCYSIRGEGLSVDPQVSSLLEYAEVQVKRLEKMRRQGGWRVVFLVAGRSESTAIQSAALARGLFSAAEHFPPLLPIPFSSAAPAPGELWWTTDELREFFRLPILELPGLPILDRPSVVASPRPKGSARTIGLGTIQWWGGTTGPELPLPVESICKHVFVAGITGSGKTTTCHRLLREISRLGIPWIVIEPAKGEYRGLLGDPDLGPDLQVFTLGRETIAPFRLNPFWFPRELPFQIHLENLITLFRATLGLFNPLPAIVEQAIHDCYNELGWDSATDGNRYGFSEAAFPTLEEFLDRCYRLIASFGYEARIQGDLRAALTVRLGGLATGAKGSILGEPEPEDGFANALKGPTIFELQNLVDPKVQALVMGLILMRLSEVRQVEFARQGPVKHLRHVVLVEEAHRLFAKQPAAAPTEEEGGGDGGSQAVRTLANMLAEFRAYGQGLIFVDQIPSKLIEEIHKNSATKIVHRLLAKDDRDIMAQTLCLPGESTDPIAQLGVGEAFVSVDGDHRPFRVAIHHPGPDLGHIGDDHIAKNYLAKSSGREAPSYCLQCKHRADLTRCAGTRLKARRVAAAKELQLSARQWLWDLIWAGDDALPPFSGLFGKIRGQAGRDGYSLDPIEMACVCHHLFEMTLRKIGVESGCGVIIAMDVANLLNEALRQNIVQHRSAAEFEPLLRTARNDLKKALSRLVGPLPGCSACLDKCLSALVVRRWHEEKHIKAMVRYILGLESGEINGRMAAMIKYQVDRRLSGGPSDPQRAAARRCLAAHIGPAMLFTPTQEEAFVKTAGII